LGWWIVGGNIRSSAVVDCVVQWIRRRVIGYKNSGDGGRWRRDGRDEVEKIGAVSDDVLGYFLLELGGWQGLGEGEDDGE